MAEMPSSVGAAAGAEGHPLLRRWAAGDGPQALRASIVLLAAEGLNSAAIARRLGVSRQTVTTWRQRYAAEGPDGLLDRSRSGRPKEVDEGEIVIGVLTCAPDDRTSRLLARRLGCSHTVVAQTRRRWNLTGSQLAVPSIPMTPAIETSDLWPVGVHLDAECTVLVLAGRPASPVPPARGVVDAYALCAVSTAMTDAVATAVETPAAVLDALAQDPDGVVHFLEAVRRTHPQSELHAVVLRARSSLLDPFGGDPRRPSIIESCARLEITVHQPPPRISEVSFACAVFGLDAARHPESSTRVLLDLAAALSVYAAGQARRRARWIREPLPALPIPTTWPTAASIGPAPRPAPVVPAGTASAAASPAAQRTAGPTSSTEVRGGANQIDLGSFNECVVIETVRVAGQITRGELAELTRLTQQSVSRITRSLIQRGFLVEERRRHSAVGKPSSPVRLRDGAAHALGIHIDPNVLTAVLVDLSGRIVARRSEPITADPRPGAVVTQIAAMGERVLEQAGRGRWEQGFLGIGVATPGPVDTVSGTVLDAPLMSVLRDVPLRTLLERRFACPIVIEKDCSAAAVGERWIGRGIRACDFVYLYLGTGVGAGLFLNGDLYRGLTANAGEFGQLCAVTLGRIDAAGRPELLPECNPASYHLVDHSLRQGGRGPKNLTVQQAAKAIGKGVLSVIDLLDVGLVVVGGPFFTEDVAHIYLTEIEHATNAYPTARRLRQVRVERSVNSSEAVAVGAASTIFHAAFTPRLRRPR
ncbi:ROK family protein [Actinospica durhamensis]|uniref:ROK family protein n=1 Tax=Actinospica durhamensis TaxID=1508375 RepID=A0A941ESN6_9ACTN|nr:ROK family protein [Actinospica durhamensis]MBR7836596.1 ROK family protein [Actinospica durhamensis]